MEITITLTDGKWLVNGKPYPQLNEEEREFFGAFLIAERIIHGANNSNQ